MCSVLIERNATAIQLPKMERCNARTMEIFRRLGVAEQVRRAGLPEDAPMDVFLAVSMTEPPLVHLPYPSVTAAKAEIATNNDGRPLEPYQLISQYTLEPLLRSIVETLPNIEVRFSCELLSFVRAVQRSIHLSEKGKSAAQQLGQTCQPGHRCRFRRGKISKSMPGSQITSRLPCNRSISSSRYSARFQTRVEPKARYTSCPMFCCSPSSPWSPVAIPSAPLRPSSKCIADG